MTALDLNRNSTPPGTSKHYEVDQPRNRNISEGEQGKVSAHDLHTDPDNVDFKKSIEISYYHLQDWEGDHTQLENDALSEERHISEEPHPDGGTIITTKIKHGDKFNHTYNNSTWRFVGLSKYDERTLVFKKTDCGAITRKSVGLLQDELLFDSSLITDFAFKFSTIPNEMRMNRTHHSTSDEEPYISEYADFDEI